MNKKTTLILFVLLLLLSSLSLHAQPDQGKAYGGKSGDQFSKVLAIPGGYLLAGQTASEDGDASGKALGSGDLWLLKTNPAGQPLWQRRYGGAGRETLAGMAAVQPGSGYYVVATVDSAHGDIKTKRGNTDIWLARLGETGDIAWQRSLGGSAADHAAGVIALPNGACLAYGHTSSADGDVSGYHGGTDIWLALLTENGEMQWSRSLGGLGTERVFKVTAMPDGGFLVIGSTQSNDDKMPRNRGEADGLLARLDAKGQVLWMETYGGSQDDELCDLIPAPDGGYFLCGHTASADGDISQQQGVLDAWVLKINAVGKVEWSRTYGDPGHDLAINLYRWSDSSLVVVGNHYGLEAPAPGEPKGKFDVVLQVIHTDGTLLKTYTYGGSGNDFAFASGFDAQSNQLFIAGLTDSEDGQVSGAKGNKDGLFFHLDKDEIRPRSSAEAAHAPIVRAFPNPAGDRVVFDQAISGWLCSELGSPLQRIQMADHADLSKFPPGVYLVRIEGSGQVLRVVRM